MVEASKIEPSWPCPALALLLPVHGPPTDWLAGWNDSHDECEVEQLQQERVALRARIQPRPQLPHQRRHLCATTHALSSSSQGAAWLLTSCPSSTQAPRLDTTPTSPTPGRTLEVHVDHVPHLGRRQRVVHAALPDGGPQGPEVGLGPRLPGVPQHLEGRVLR